MNRRKFFATAAALGAAALWAGEGTSARASVREQRSLFPEGVASGDPDTHSVLLWTRYPRSEGSHASLSVEVAEDETFRRVVATATTRIEAASDWTCRILVGNLRPASLYWYRFIDPTGNASRCGRTQTAPPENDDRPVKFAFVSCQEVPFGAQHAYRRMIFEDERARESERIGFVLHLGDFIYEAVWYPEDNPERLWGRRLRDIVRYPHGQKIGDFHIPTTLDDYRAVYRAYLRDPDLQDARARWPFVCIWDNHEFSWSGWQSMQRFNEKNIPAQTRKIAANQAWFEYQPARIVKSSGPGLARFDPPAVVDTPIDAFDNDGLGHEPNNLAAITSLTGYRAVRWGRNVELAITDQRSYCSEAPTEQPEARVFTSEDFPRLFPQEALEILDAGRAYAGGNPPATIYFGGKEIANYRKHAPPRTILGAAQKQWFLKRLKDSRATWKIWGNTLGTFEWRCDPQHLPAGLTRPWPGSGYSSWPGDFGGAYWERAEIYGAIRKNEITGFAVLCGNSHSFWAGLVAPSLPPQPFNPIGVGFVTGAISSTSPVESLEHSLPIDHPLRALYLLQSSPNTTPEPTFNMLLRHGVRTCLEYQRTGDIERARRMSNAELAPHLSFLDLDGHGYATVRASSDALECEFVCIPRPVERATALDGGPLSYRVLHRAPLWKAGGVPKLEQRLLEGDPKLSL